MNEKKQTYLTAAIGSLLILLMIAVPLPVSKSLRKKLVLFYQNIEANDNSKNWSCHNYAYNLMKTAEPNAIFMTEGGDNQVFSLLYFSYVERMRPDVDFYDQKGNVFPRLYGDLMRPRAYFVDGLIRDLRDFQLYSTGRPVYLTWKRQKLNTIRIEEFPKKVEELKNKVRSNPNLVAMLDQQWKLYNLNNIKSITKSMVPRATFDQIMKSGEQLGKQAFQYLGPWFYQTYGIMHRVTPLRYAIVQGLEVFKSADEGKLINYIRRVSQITPTHDEFLTYVSQLKNEGYITSSGNTYKLRKPQDMPFPEISHEDYWQGYYFHYTNIDNAPEWDYLTREIFFGYVNSSASYNERTKNLYKEKSTYENDPAKKARYNVFTAEYDKRIENTFVNSLKYGRENPQITYHYANMLLRKGLYQEAIKYFIQASGYQKDMHIGYLTIANIYYQQSRSMASEEAILSNLTLASDYIEKSRGRLELQHQKRNKLSEVNKHQDWMKIDGLGKKIKGEINVPKSMITEQIAKTKNNNVNELLALAGLYEKRYDFNEASQTYDKVIKINPTDISLYYKKYQLLQQYNPMEAVKVLENTLAKFHTFKNTSQQQKWQLLEACGMFYFNAGRQYFGQNSLPNAKMYFTKSKQYLEQFLVETFNMRSQPQLAGKISQIERVIKEIDSRLTSINRVLNNS
jgi:tetratricopeptide (TPR) repeat protein